MSKSIEEIKKDLSKSIDFIGEIGSLSSIKKIDSIPFGIPSLDEIINGGMPRGMIGEIFGKPSQGKTSLTLKLISEAQKRNIDCAFIDVELAITRGLAEKFDVDTEKLLILRPATGEEVFESIEALSERGFGLIVVDSVASISPTSEIESDYTDQTIGLQARLISKSLRKLIGCIYRNNTSLLFINQIRAVMARMPGQKTSTTSGGISIPFYAAIRLEVVRTGWIKKGTDTVGMNIKIKTEKNKIGPPQKQVNIDFLFETGWDVERDKVNMMLKNKELELIGRTFYDKAGNKIGTYDKLSKYLLDQ